MRRFIIAFALVILVLPILLALRCPLPEPVDRDKIELPGLSDRVRVSTDALGVPHVSASALEDAVRVQGYLHARDRFFQMDVSRRTASGTLAELTGSFADLTSDAQTRTLGLRTAAQRSLDALEPVELAMLEAYVDGVNAWLASNPLPPEYAALEVSAVPPWTPLDTLAMVKGLAAAFTVRLGEVDETAYVQGYVDVLGEEAAALFYPDEMGRFAPWAPYATVPDALGVPLAAAQAGGGLKLGALRDAGRTAQRMRSRAAETGFLAQAFEQRNAIAGSNAWGVAASHSATGLPLVAGDGHDALTAPARDYEIHLVVADNPLYGPLNVSGTSPPGVPGVATGQNTRVAWASTALGTDASDIFRDRLIRDDPSCPARLCILSAGEIHPVEQRSETYRMNSVGNGVPDDSVDATFLIPPQAVDVLSIPFRSFGPVLEVDDRSVLTGGEATETGILTLQWTGLHADRSARYLLDSMRARDVFEFLDAVQWFTVPGGSGNFVVADVDGNLAYAATGEIPLRADLETGTVAGAPPWLIREGSGPANWVPDPARSQGQVIPFAVIPREEMPHVVNPPAGFVVNCNEDPSGFGLDNDLLNQFRPSKPSAIHYLGDWGTWGLRNGRVTRLLQEKIDAGERLSLDDMKRIQGNNQPLHAELLVPHLLAAFEAAQEPGAPAELAALAADPRVAEAAGRLAAWNFSTPTGIPEGYDASDEDGVRTPDVSTEEAAHSVAATLYGVWIWETLSSYRQGLASQGLQPIYGRAATTLSWLLEQEPFTTVGASGVDFIPEPSALAEEDRRDLLLLGELRDALDALASPAYAAAFAGSTNQNDYRWGKLNRVVIEHPLGGAWSIPPAGGFEDLAPGLPGLARDSTWETVNVSDFGAFPTRANDWVSSFGPIWRHVHSPLRPSESGSGMLGFAALVGGASGDPASPLYASQLGSWLTVDYHQVPITARDVRVAAERVELFTPVAP